MSLPEENGIYLDHIAVATGDLEKSVDIFSAMGLKFSNEREVVSDQKVKTAFAKIDHRANLELLEPINGEGPIQSFIDKKGQGIHHICFSVPNVLDTMKDLKSKGFTFIYDEPKRGAHQCLINFIHPKSTGGILIEVSQKQS
jgi:methylmalonyl-CoA epimerase